MFKVGASGFPTQTFGSSNYWVDVVFDTTPVDITPPTVTAASPAANATDVAVNANVTVTFSETMNLASITTDTIVLQNGAGSPVPAAITYNSATRTATLNPTDPLPGSTSYTAIVRGGPAGVKDFAGNAMPSDVTLDVHTGTGAGCPCTIWPDTATPAVAADPSSGGIELGVKWRAEVDGFVTGLRFYKGPGNTGTHIGNVWTSTGTLLGTVTFTGETATGWQQAMLPSPIPVLANTTYVTSYHTTTGHFSTTQNFFAAAGVDAPPLHALANGAAGGNGVFVERATSGFPNQSFASTNYWVDVVFETATGPDTTPPSITAVAPASGATGVGPGVNVVATFSERMNPATITTSTVELRTATSGVVPATVTYNDVSRTATLDPTGPLASLATYSATVKGGAAGVKDIAGNPLAGDLTWTFTTGAAPTCPCTIWPATATPAMSADPFGGAIELGVKWRAETDGFVTALRFYKDATNTGTHIGNLWTSWGPCSHAPRSAAKPPPAGSRSRCPTPVPVLANTTYVASYHTTVGHFSVTQDMFALAGVDAPPLHALANDVAGGNGVFVESATTAFPTSRFSRATTGSTSCSYRGREQQPADHFRRHGHRRRTRTRRPAAIGFTVGDIETAAASLTVTGSSSNTDAGAGGQHRVRRQRREPHGDDHAGGESDRARRRSP